MENEKYDISGMSCAACQSRVENAVKKVKGVTSCSVNLLMNSMLVSYDGITKEDIIDAVKKSGYGAKLSENKSSISTDEKLDKATKNLILKFIFSFIILVPLFYISMGYMLGWPLFGLESNIILLTIIEMALSLLIMGINNHFYINGIKAIFMGGPNMDTLVALGSLTSFVYSSVLFVLMLINASNSSELMRLSMNLSFETAGMVPTLITIGKILESYSKGKTTSAIKALLKLAPKIAHVIKDDEIIDISIEMMAKGDIFIVRPGETFPADGIVIEGISSVDESSLTGESLPVDKTIDSQIKSGTINLNGVLKCEAEKVGSDTILSQVIKMVETASGTKTEISRIADKVSSFFVPIVIGISLITFILWLIFGESFVSSLHLESTTLSYAIDRGVSVLVISCPCALGLATPTAIMVGNGKAAKNGILFKTAHALEKTNKAKYVVLDKTGTITKGMPEVSDIISYELPNEELIKIAYSLEENSEHPLAKAIIRYAIDHNIKAYKTKEITALPGVGISGLINKSRYLVVNESYLVRKKIIKKLDESLINLKKQGKTLSFILKNDHILGLISLKDTLKDDSIIAIDEMKKLGLIPVMLTGDNNVTASEIAKETHIDYFIAEVLPLEKLKVIRELKKQGSVIMVGDGINDAPALTEADIGVAIARGSDIALDSAEVILMGSSLSDIPKMIRISKATYLNIKENLFWAFFYNIIMIPIAAGAFIGLGLASLKPWMGSLAMALSSLTVVLNALRLNLFDMKNNELFNKVSDNIIDIDSVIYSLKGENEMKKEVKIEGMMCMHCVAHVKEALLKVEGIKNADVSLEKGNALIEGEVSNEAIKEAIINAGYKVLEIK